MAKRFKTPSPKQSNVKLVSARTTDTPSTKAVPTPPPARPTLDQQRAAYAWERVQQNQSSDYANLAKAAPALIMNNGLMQALAFYRSKDKKHHKDLLRDLLDWLRQRKLVADSDFTAAMADLVKAQSATFRQATEEALALLRWLRQFAAAVNTESTGTTQG